MRELVRLRTRPSRDGQRYTYMLDYLDEDGKRRRISLGHADRRKAERQRTQKERELRMGVVGSMSMKLSGFLEDSLSRTGDQIRESTRIDYESAMKDFIKVVGDIDFRKVRQSHGELFRQVCLDQGNAPGTTSKKLREVGRLFALAVERKQLEENPFKYVKMPKSPRKRIRVYTDEECTRILKAASQIQGSSVLRWDLMITLALTTAMRKSELLNLVWTDLDFSAMTIEVNPKESTDETWEWKIKDTDRRTLPLTEESVQLLADLQSRRPDGYPYVLVPPNRYDHIQQKLRPYGKWTLSSAKDKIINNFKKQFDKVLARARVKAGTFHDLRKTAITNWFRQGLSEYDVMTLAGHSNFRTTHEFYLAVADDLVDRARDIAARTIGQVLSRGWRAPLLEASNEKSQQA